ncbi:MAG TPA: fumarate hydratase [Pseudothermotoga sp.]|nr:fumarate hydratase [Pseudothermotoga sp.]HOK82747.1 fumarate hydratase [Pseudothermotoga sp.]
MKVFMVDSNMIRERMVQQLLRANTIIDDFVEAQIKQYNGPFEDVLKKNIIVAQQSGLPLCQDTGMVEFFVFTGHAVVFTEPVEKTLNDAVREAYTKYPFRYSVVKDPIFDRRNTLDNTPAIVHIFFNDKGTVQIRFLVKGGGSENLTRLFMLNPSSTTDEIVELVVNHIKESGAKGCPPLKIGIGVGGSADKAIVLSKLALTRNSNEHNEDDRYADLEKRILDSVNELKIGFQGLSVGITAYSVHIEHAPTHIANLPVAVSVDCYLCRKGVVDIEPERTENI